MSAVRRLEAVSCDGYRSACSRAGICCGGLPCAKISLHVLSQHFFLFPFSSRALGVFFEFPMTDFYFVKLLVPGATTTAPTADPPRPPISRAGLTQQLLSSVTCSMSLRDTVGLPVDRVVG